MACGHSDSEISASESLSLQNRLQRLPQLRAVEGIAAVDQTGGLDSLAGKQNVLAHLAKQRFDRECGHGKNGRAFQHRCERFGEFVIRSGIVAATGNGRDFHANTGPQRLL